jgi:hypothetical protein
MKYFYDTEFLDDGKTIELISIGIVREDGETYYAVNADMDYLRVIQSEWLVANVMNQLPDVQEWKPKAQIRAEVEEFLLRDGSPELWAWFAAYDHVVLSQLFGRMLDLPRGMPMFTHDLRSLVDWVGVHNLPQRAEGSNDAHDALADAQHLKVQFEYVHKVLVARDTP